MKKSVILPLLFVIAIGNCYAQINPVQDLVWSQWYQTPNNFFQLIWDPPATPHNELMGYNIYRNNELYRFQSENSLYNLYSDVYGYVSNCDVDFLGVDNQNQPYAEGFEVHVTAVYNPGMVESEHLQSYFVTPPALANSDFTPKKVKLFPNPTNGILMIEDLEYDKIAIYDMTGKLIKELAASSRIDVGGISKGIYIVKLFSAQKVIEDRLIIE